MAVGRPASGDGGEWGNDETKQQRQQHRYFRHSEYIQTTTMSVPAPIVTGTIIYALLGAALIAGVMGARITGMMSKDNAA